ncbi:Serine/threonine-protein kinase ulk3 [Geranomyces variabilis]|uniref:non-specific serine/threonine protein kinase n=1 Tax=Geranomyces variabilis TaxID=109894 RepID=A0AAD5TEK8_9FUNG|nr:Serine/threonine-protein kinase ulk3 [Geranomyces variabilis]
MSTAATTPAPPLAYGILQPPIGRGTSGTVHRAFLKFDPLALPRFAVKVIQRADLRRSRKQEQVVREIALLKRLSHPNVVKFVDVEWDASCVRVVMELCTLGSLSDFLRARPGGRLEEAEAKGLLRQLAAGLSFLQSRNIAHRDIKSSNLLLTQSDPPSRTLPTLKIADFGIADDRHAQPTARTALEGGALTERIGTLLYMAPEVLTQDRYDSRCDLWSVGVVFYEMLVGKLPFRPVTSIDALLAQILSATPPSLSLPPQIASRTSAPARALVSALLTRNPAARLSFRTLFADPYLDLTHLPGPESLARGMERIVQAMEIEEQTSFAPAEGGGAVVERLDGLVDLYAAGIAHLLAYRDYLGPSHPGMGELVERIAAYIDRAEDVKELAQRLRQRSGGGSAAAADECRLMSPSPLHAVSTTAMVVAPSPPRSPATALQSRSQQDQHRSEALRSLQIAATLAADTRDPGAALPHFDRGLALLLASLAASNHDDNDDNDSDREARLTEACTWMDAAEAVRRRVEQGVEQKGKNLWSRAGQTVVKKGALINVVYNGS